MGIPALRIRGAQLAVVTLAAALAIQSFVFSNPAISRLEGNIISDPTLFGMDLGIRDGSTLVTLLTVAENLKLARRRGGPGIDMVFGHFPALEEMRSRRCGNLSGGEQQMLALGKALLGGPRVLLIDELSLGLSPIAVKNLLPRLRAVADESDLAVVLVEQHIDLALGIADHAMVLHHGRVELSAPGADLRADRGLVEAAYFGTYAASGSDV